MDPSNYDVRRMALHFCKLRSGPCHQYPNQMLCKVCYDAAAEAIRLGAKLPDLRMERGRVAYEAHCTAVGSHVMPRRWDELNTSSHEAWARAAEAARNAP